MTNGIKLLMMSCIMNWEKYRRSCSVLYMYTTAHICGIYRCIHCMHRNVNRALNSNKCHFYINDNLPENIENPVLSALIHRLYPCYQRNDVNTQKLEELDDYILFWDCRDLCIRSPSKNVPSTREDVTSLGEQVLLAPLHTDDPFIY